MKTNHPVRRTLIGLGIFLLVAHASERARAQTCTSPASGIISWFPGDGNADDIQGDNNGTLQNGATFGAGEVDQAFNFNGVNQYVHVGGSLPITGSRTITAWVFANPSTGLGRPITTGGVSGAGDFFGIAGTTGPCSSVQYELYVDHWGTPCYESHSAITPNAWNHVALTYDGATLRFYVNGVAGTAVIGSLYDYNINTYDIGGNNIGGSSTQPSFDGLIDELDIYNRALSQAEIRAIFDAGSAGKCKPAIRPSSLPNAEVGSPYNQTITAAGGTAPYTYSIVSGSLPPGLAWNAGVISGTPQTAGVFGFTVQVMDSANHTVQRTYSISIVTYTVLYQLGTDAGDPLQPAGIVAIAQGRDGYLYTTSQFGGTSNEGTMFNATPFGTVSVVWSFGHGLSGNNALSGVTLGTDGNFYGTTETNGEGPGTAYQLTPAGVYTVLRFFGNTGDGSCPWAPPIEGTDGNYYGTTSTVCGFGALSTVYRLTSTGTLTTLYTFTDGSNMTAPLVQGTDGNFYGVTESGGANNDGVIFKMTPGGIVTVLHTFAGTDGSQAYRPLIQASDGNFYGTTNGGGGGAGVIFRITPSGSYTVLHSFNASSDGSLPFNLIQATNGTLYGTTQEGGPSNLGTIFSITTSGTFTVLLNFDGTNGGIPQSLKQHTNGILYGVTNRGGDLSLCSSNGCGVFYSLDIGEGAFCSLVSTSGKEGAMIGILGQGFSSSSVVKFGGTQATAITLSGTTLITATVPAGALTGLVTVRTGATTLTSNSIFRVTPTLDSFSPTSGPVGTPVVITGTGLLQTTKVTFNRVAVTTFTINSDTQVTADVPTGATTGKIAITTRGGTATSTRSFAVGSPSPTPTPTATATATPTATPTATATATPTATATATATPTATPTATATFTPTPTPTPTPRPLRITTTSLPTPVWMKPYSATIRASGGTQPYTFAITVGALPFGLSMSTSGVISGTPTQPFQTANFTVQVTDSGNPVQTATANFSMTVVEPLAITTTTLPGGTVGQAYSASIGASGGTQPYTFSIIRGSLPNGLSLSASGVISGTPTSAGTSHFTVQVKDSSNPVLKAMANLSITVSP